MARYRLCIPGASNHKMSKKNLHILIIPESKSAMHTSQFIKMLANAGYVVTYVNSRKFDEINEERVNYIEMSSFPWLRWIKPFVLQTIIVHWAKQLYLRWVWYKLRPDITHVHGIGEMAYYGSISGIHPFVLTAWGSDINQYFPLEEPLLESSYSKAILKHRLLFDGGQRNMYQKRKRTVLSLQSANYVTADTNELLRRCEILSNRKLRKTLFYYGVDDIFFDDISDEELQSFRKSIGLPADALIILSNRRIQPGMGHICIINAFAKALRKTNRKIILVMRNIFRSDDSYLTKVENLIAEQGIDDNVIWVEQLHYERMPWLLKSSSVVINYPSVDGMPSTLFEAAACRVPIITSNLPVYQEFLENTDCFKVIPDDSGALSDAILAGINIDQHVKQKMIDKNYDWVNRNLRMDNVVEKIGKVYRSLV